MGTGQVKLGLRRGIQLQSPFYKVNRAFITMRLRFMLRSIKICLRRARLSGIAIDESQWDNIDVAAIPFSWSNY